MRNPISTLTRQASTALGVGFAIVALAGCGKDDEAPSVSQAQVPAIGRTASTATVPGVATGQTTPRVTAPQPGGSATEPATGTSGTEDEGRTTTAPTGRTTTTRRPATGDDRPSGDRDRGRGSDRTPGSATTPKQPDTPANNGPRSETPPQSTAAKQAEAPLECLGAARLQSIQARSPGTWRGLTSEGDKILVDGPYASADAARDSASTLEGITRAEPGGTYVVSAALTADVGAKVSEVARCLKDKTT